MANDNFDLPRPTDAVPSATSAVLNDNSKVLDYVINGEGVVINRAGNELLTLDEALSRIDWNYVGLFADGVTFESKTDFAVDAVGIQWAYSGSDPFPKISPPGTVPSSPDYQVVHAGSLQLLSGLTDPSDLDSVMTRTFTNVASMIAASTQLTSGFVYSSGGTTWRHNGGTLGTIADFDLISNLNILDYGVSNEGVLSDAEIQTCIDNHQAAVIEMPAGEYNFSAIPTGIDTVELRASVKQRISWTNIQLPTYNTVYTGGSDVAIVAGVIRYYAADAVEPGSAAGWYTIFDGSGNHDPILVDGVTASGSASLRIALGVDTLGFDPADWQPGGFVVGCDESLADSGCTFGASVSPQEIQIFGSYNTGRTNLVTYDGANWVSAGSGYTFAWTAGATGRLTVTRPAAGRKKAFNQRSINITPKRSPSVGGAGYVDCALDTETADNFSVTFWDATNTNINTENTNMQFYVTDGAMDNLPFNFGGDPGGTSNIWFVGAFSKSKGAL